VNDEAPLARYETSLRGLARKNRLRTLAARAGTDFASNDYLGLAASQRLGAAIAAALAAGTPVGTGGSRLLRGNCPEHEAVEAAAAAFFRVERALFFGGGYVANPAVLTTLPQKGDLIILDELVHASAHEGAQAGRAEVVKATHNDPAVFDAVIRTWHGAGGSGRIWTAFESLYSMDGDRAPLADLAALAERHEAFLLIDEAHATGVYGPDGRGRPSRASRRAGEHRGAAYLLQGPRGLALHLRHRALAPALVILREEPARRERLGALIDFAGRALEARCGLAASGSQILPVVIDNGRAMALAAALQARGFHVCGVRPPTVPEGTARLRVSLTLNVDEAAITALFDALAEAMRSLAA
jgi:8-amino-7-oxononanoate synthase